MEITGQDFIALYQDIVTTLFQWILPNHFEKVSGILTDIAKLSFSPMSGQLQLI